ncbi:MAG TPA: hypothetical protein VHP37_16950 [Burkholderiales bacterium]|nr:hypothetical protein [Burkholderiales bacterium]
MEATGKVAVAALIAMMAGSVLAAEPIGVVNRSKGDVRIEREGEHLKAGRGALIYRGDRVITGPSAHASITMRRTAPLTLGPGNDIPIDRYAADEVPTVKRSPPAILQSLASYFAVNRQR